MEITAMITTNGGNIMVDFLSGTAVLTPVREGLVLSRWNPPARKTTPTATTAVVVDASLTE